MIRALSSLVITVLLVAPSHEQTTLISPCPDVFTYEPPGPHPRRWYGVIKLSTSDTLQSPSLTIVLDSEAEILGNWEGDVTSNDNINFRVENSTLEIRPGQVQTFRFFVQYKRPAEPPKLQAIKLNDLDICNDRGRPIPFSISQELEDDSSANNQESCGTVAPKFTPLVVLGKPTQAGQWPWQIALYRTKSVNNKFTCGGTLVSRLHVITAAHCVTVLGTRTEVERDTLLVYLGKHNLRTTVRGVQVRFVDEIIVYREYEPLTLLGDVAILKLHEPVTFSHTVRPACLWPDDLTDLQNVVGKLGSVVGWGFDHTGVLTEDLFLLEIPVVDQETCLRSYPVFFSRVTSSKTFCAGRRDGTSVCNGDSGGGMVFKMKNRWYLRGLVSGAVSDKNKLTCDPAHYAVFADLAKYLPWIKQNIKVE